MSVLKDLIGQAEEYFSVSFLYHLTAIHNHGHFHATFLAVHSKWVPISLVLTQNSGSE